MFDIATEKRSSESVIDDPRPIEPPPTAPSGCAQSSSQSRSETGFKCSDYR